MGSVLSRRRLAAATQRPGHLGRHDDGYQSQALSTRLGIPIIYGVDAVHGDGGVKGTVLFPHNIGLGARAARRSCRRRRASRRARSPAPASTGRSRPASPCPRRALGPHLRGLRRDRPSWPSCWARRPCAVSRRRRSPNPARAILACAKHFLGDGGTFGGKDQGDTKVTEEELRKIHLPGYVACVKAGVGSGDGLVSELERDADARQPATDHRRPQGRARLPGVRGHRLGGHRQDVEGLQAGRRGGDQRRHRHGDGADPLPRVRRPTSRSWSPPGACRWRASTTPSGGS